ncbi:SanA/YdcF family protein [Litchfieldella anticariensis]|nr:ElyC/SanA/YdcF family protein [Halomonas anticariensis]
MRQRLLKLLRGLLMSLGVVALLAILLSVGANLWILGKTQSRIEHDLLACGTAPVGIVFGTSYWNRGGGRNPHFEARMLAASRVIGERRVKHLLLSGDNRTRSYNEPITMWRDLRGRKVRDEDMTLDYAGFSTFDTLVRSRDVFGVERAVLITQPWHLPRAMFIADALGLEVTGCAAPSEHVPGVWRLKAREWLARLATVGDLYVWKRQPYFLGPKEPLQIAPYPGVRPPRYETLDLPD